MRKTKEPHKADIYPGAPIVSDPSGSYTGRPAEPTEEPVQDADDL